MEKINSWCRIIALISLLSSVLLLVVPESRIKKAFKTLLSFILIYAFISPLSNIDADFSFVDNYLSGVSSDSQEKIINDYQYYPVIQAGEAELEIYFNDIISKCGAQGKCEVICNYEEERILIKEVIIHGLIGEKERNLITDEVRKVGDEETIISFSGEEYG